MPTNVRGPVAIVARGTDPSALVDNMPPGPHEFPEPALIGYVRLVDCIEIPADEVIVEMERRFGKTFAQLYPKHYIPRKSPVYLWLLTNPRPLKRPRGVPLRRSRVWIRLPSGGADQRAP